MDANSTKEKQGQRAFAQQFGTPRTLMHQRSHAQKGRSELDGLEL